MDIQELRIGSHILHKGIHHLVSAISASNTVYIQPRIAKVYLQVPVEELEPVDLTPEIFNALRFESNGNHFAREKLYLTRAKGYPAYLKDRDGHQVYIGMCIHLHRLQNLYFDLHLQWLILP